MARGRVYYDPDFGEFFFQPDTKVSVRHWVRALFYTMLLRFAYRRVSRDAKRARNTPNYGGPMF